MRTRSGVVLGGLVALGIVGGLTYLYVDAQPPGSGGVTGKLVGQSDVGLPDGALGHGTFLVVPGVTVHDLWPDVAGPGDGPVFQYIAPTLDVDALVEDVHAVLVEVQPDGRFRINAPAGPAVVCLLEASSIVGCVEIDLPERGSLRAARGEGGFFIE